MFITKEEAERRRLDPRNVLGPNYVREVPEKPVAETSDGNGSRIPEDNEVPPALGNKDIDAILSKAVDPFQVRRRTTTLHGQKDVQVAIGTTAMILGPNDAGKVYGLSEPQTRAYEQGLSSTKDITEGRPPDESRRLRLSAAKEALAETAAQRLHTALGALTNDKISECSAPKVSAIAKDMAVVMDKVTRDNAMPEHIHFHVFKPEMKTIRDYTTVQVSSPVVGIQPGGGTD